MESVLLNQVGIVLNFLAGFMLAPELLGLERLRRIETYIEKRLTFMSNLADKIGNKFSSFGRGIGDSFVKAGLAKPSFTNNVFAVHSLAVCIILLVLALFVGVVYITYIIFGKVVASVIMFYLYIKSVINPELSDHDEGWYPKLLLTNAYLRFLLPIYMVIAAFALILYPFYIVIALATKQLLSFIIRKLEGEARLRSVLIWWGIIFFILGNALQFIATFDTRT
jgi:hypothetical protein